MNKLIGVISKIKWIGMIGIIGNLIYPSRSLKLIGLIMLLGLVEIFYNLPIFIQSLKQVISLPYIYIVHGFRLPSKDNYRCETEFILPFAGRWAVVKASQRVLDSKIYGNGKLDYDIKDIRGNYIIIKHNKNEYSFIAHIKPGSILVKKGQALEQGEEIARCGNSGNSSEPHIHFHVQDGISFFASAGLPICFMNVKISKEEYYKKYDTRPLPELKEDSNEMEGYIHRGQFVETVQ